MICSFVDIFFFVAGAVIITLIASVTLVVMAIVWRYQLSRERGRRLDEETRLLQEIHRGLEKMEPRVEALEEIMLEQSAGGQAESNDDKEVT